MSRSLRSLTVALIAGHFLATSLFAELHITVTTHSYEGDQAPKNIAAVWIENAAGEFVKTIALWSLDAYFMMKNWATAAGTSESTPDEIEVDGITAATRDDHTLPITATWNLTGQDGNRVPEGVYTFHVEFSESDYWWGEAEAYLGKTAQGSVVIGTTPQTVTVEDSEWFTGFSATYLVTSVTAEPAPRYTKERLVFNNSGRQLVLMSRGSPGTVVELQLYDLRGRLLRRLNASMENGSTPFTLGKIFSRGIFPARVKQSGGRTRPVRNIAIVR